MAEASDDSPLQRAPPPKVEPYLSKFTALKVRQWRTNYKRIFGLKQSGFVTIDPTDFSVTNTFTYAAMKKLETSKKDPEEFTFSCGSAMTFRTQYRSHLLTELVRLRAMTVDETALGLVPCHRGRAEAHRRSE